MKKLFGTDGIRGLVNKELDSDLALKLGASVARVLKKEQNKKELTFLIGTDTRISKDMLVSAITSGFLSEGCHIINLGVIPTPAVAYLTKLYQVDGGFVVSASHNPSDYNGIKVFDKNGFKLTDELESKIEDIILNEFKLNNEINNVGTLTYKDDAIMDYVDFLANTVTNDFSNLKIVLDTANGASSKTVSLLFDKLKANYIIINNNPDGYNINSNCGSCHLDSLIKKVIENNADLGIAFDGDADRVLFISDKGDVIDGDYVLAIVSYYKNIKNIVGTVMSNLGLIKYCEENNINFISTKVGDYYVLSEMIKNNYLIGGEQSGHIIFKDILNTGDGELTALQILDIMVENNKSLDELSKVMKKYPQVLKNINTTKEGKEKYKNSLEIKNKIQEYQDKLGDDIRIVVRESGTENLIRVMIEGQDLSEINKYCLEIINYIDSIINI